MPYHVPIWSFPVLLPFGEGVFLQHFVGGYDEHGSGGFKANSSFYADYCVADMHVASDAEFRSASSTARMASMRFSYVLPLTAVTSPLWNVMRSVSSPDAVT